MEISRIKPCPFCGNTSLYVEIKQYSSTNEAAVHCPNCDASGPREALAYGRNIVIETIEAAISAWNCAGEN